MLNSSCTGLGKTVTVILFSAVLSIGVVMQPFKMVKDGLETAKTVLGKRVNTPCGTIEIVTVESEIKAGKVSTGGADSVKHTLLNELSVLYKNKSLSGKLN